MGMVRRVVILIAMILGAPSVMAAQAVNVVEIANFFCPECYQAYQSIQPLEKTIKDTGGQFDFVPTFYGKVSRWPSLVYLSTPKKIKILAQKALFSAAIGSGMPMNSAESACTVVNDLAPHYSVQTCINRANSSLPGVHLMRALKLLQHIYGKKGALVFPIFIIEQGGKIKTVLSRSQYPQVSELLKEVKVYVQST